MNLLALTHELEKETAGRPCGYVTQVVGLTVESVGPAATVGDRVWIETTDGDGVHWVPAEVVGFRDRAVLMIPLESVCGVRPGARVVADGRIDIPVGYGLLGRVVNGLGCPVDRKGPLTETTRMPINGRFPAVLDRPPLRDVFVTGIRAVDAALTCARGQRLGIFSGSGVGKSRLLGILANHSSATINVIALIGERSREVREFVETCLGESGLRKSVVVVATADESPVMRTRGASTAVALAEYFRERGEHVLLLMDSMTRYAMAHREIGLAAGEPPATKGYPPSVFGQLAKLAERCGASARGTVTGFFSVLVEQDDMADPVADAARAVLDGHIVLSRALAEMGHYPAIDILASVSRLMTEVCEPAHRELACRLRALLSVYRRAEDLINVGAYVPGSNPRLDEAVRRIEGIMAFLRQDDREVSSWDATLAGLRKAVS